DGNERMIGNGGMGSRQRPFGDWHRGGRRQLPPPLPGLAPASLAIRPQGRPDLSGWLAQAALTDRAPAPALGGYPDWSELPGGACSPSLRPPAGTGAGALFNVWLGPAQVHIGGRSAPKVLGAPATRARCGRDRGVELAPAPSLEAARLPARQWQAQDFSARPKNHGTAAGGCEGEENGVALKRGICC